MLLRGRQAKQVAKQEARTSQYPCVVSGKRIAAKEALGGLRNTWQEPAPL